MSSPSPARLPRWPFLVILVLTVAGLWLLDGRQPEPWPDAAAPWFEHVRGLSAASGGIDLVNAGVPLTPDLPLGSLLVVVVVAGATLATLLTCGVSAVLAVSVALGLVAVRSVWSTATTGADALDIAIVALVVLALARQWRPAATTVAVAVATIGFAPWAAWAAVPGVALPVRTRRARLATSFVLLGLATAVQAAWLQHVWSGIACLAPGGWAPALFEVLRPGTSADASAWRAVRQATDVIIGDVHLFGLAVSALGLWCVPGESRQLRAATMAVVTIALVGVASGFVSPARSAALLSPWWAVWFGVGLTILLESTHGRARSLALACCMVLALATPVLRHATVLPAPWVGGTPAIARAVAADWGGEPVVSDSAVLVRRLHLAGATTLPADARTLAACVANDAPLHAVGATIPIVERLGYRVTTRPLTAPLGALLRDLRPDQLVALALPPSAIAWAGPTGVGGLSRLSMTRDQLTRSPAVAVLARTDRGGSVRADRDGADVTVAEGGLVGGLALTASLSVSAHDDDAVVARAGDRLATSRYAALAVFDRAQELSLRAVGEFAPGLPLSLLRDARWRHVEVSGEPACVPASRSWTSLALRAGRVSLPAAGASPRRPVVLYAGSIASTAANVAGLATSPGLPGWTAQTLDTKLNTDAIRLAALLDADGVPAALRPRARWVTRVTIGPSGAWDGGRAVVTAGSGVQSWLVRLAAGGRRPETNTVCAQVHGGDPLLRGQYGVLDDESAREVAVYQADGWHPAERVHGETFHWTAQPTATAIFHVARSAALRLALDVEGAETSAGPQAVTVRLNGLALRSDWHGAGRVDLPVDLVRAGDNVLSLEVAEVVQPPRDARSLGVLVRQLRVIDPTRP